MTNSAKDGSGSAKPAKRVLITGGAGFIGSHLVEECISRGWEVSVIDTNGPQLFKFLAGASLRSRNYIVACGSITNQKALASEFAERRPDYIFHLAAEPYIPKSYDDPRLFIDTNIVGTLNVLELAQQVKAERVLIISSSEVYGCRDSGTRLTEDSPLSPISTYAVTKLAADRLAISRSIECGVPAIVLRPFNCYGGRATQSYVIPEVISQAHRGDTIKLGNIKSARDFSYVADTAWAMAEIIEKGNVGEVYHYGSGTVRTIESIVDVVSEVMNKPLMIEVDQSRLRPADVTWLWADNSKFNSVVDATARPLTRFEDGIRQTIDWFRANGERWPYEPHGVAGR
jgi:nucleoside-diphosphate-sugar epimerase